MAQAGRSPKKKSPRIAATGKGDAIGGAGGRIVGEEDWRPTAGELKRPTGNPPRPESPSIPGFQGALLSAGEAMFILDAAGSIRFWNDGARELFGYDAREILGRGAGFLLEGGWPLRKADAGPSFPPVKVRGIGVRKGGARFPLELSQGFPDGESGFTLACARDRSDSEASEAALELSEKRHHLLREELEYRIRFENLITSISTHFIHLPSERIDTGINYALHVLGEFAEVDRSYIFIFSQDQATVENTHEWCSKGVAPQIRDLKDLPVSRYPWFMGRIRELQTVHIPRVSELGSEAAAEKEEFEKEGIQSLVIVPMIHKGVLRGYLGFDSVRREKSWSGDIIQALRMAGEIFINALERKTVDQALSEAKARYLDLFENAVEGIYQTTPEGLFLAANPALARILGYGDAREMMLAVTDIAGSIYVQPGRRMEFLRILRERGRIVEFESQARRKDGAIIWISENARAARKADGELDFCEGTVMDVTERKRMEEQLIHGALHDALTGLPNRVLLLERLGRALERSRRKPAAVCAVMVLDVDRFKMVNESMGYALGDRLLVAIARRLEVFLPPGTTLARLGGDEFGMLLEDFGDFGQATLLADRLREMLSMAFDLDGREIYAPASIGIALGCPRSPGPEELLRDADTAMHRAKAAGKGRCEVFDDSMHANAVHLLTLETDLRKALERVEFRLHYQPIVSLEDCSLIGFEALIRWQHPRLGLVSPADFIPLAEDTGLIVPIGKWVLQHSCRQLVEWQGLITGGKPLSMSVNLSGRQLQDLALVDEIGAILKDAGMDSSALKLEVTESAIMGNPEMAAAILNSLKDAGIHLSLDDFGTGYSSLSYLHRFPFHNLKIDRSFVSKLESGDKDAEIVKVINSLARNLGMDVVAEGIETVGQWAMLHGLSCAYGQGYYFSRPLDEAAARKLIEAGGFAPRGPADPASLGP